MSKERKRQGERGRERKRERRRYYREDREIAMAIVTLSPAPLGDVCVQD